MIAMTNIVDLRTHRELQRGRTCVEGRVAVVADLVALSSGIKEVVEKTVELDGPSPLHLEQAVQHLVDALHHLENAMGVLTEDGEWEPF